MKLHKILIMLACTPIATNAQTTAQKWLEADSAKAIQSRLEADFSLTIPQAVQKINQLYNLGIDSAQLIDYANNHYVELKNINGQNRIHRKSPSNLKLLHPALNGGVKPRGATASPARISYVTDAIEASQGNGTLKTPLQPNAARTVNFTFTIDVPYDAALKGDTLRVWMPVPLETPRQQNITILNTSQPDYILSSPQTSPHNTIYFEAPVVEGKDSHFEYTAQYTALSQYFAPEYILENIRPYDKTSALYQEYTQPQAPHIIIPTELAREIVGSETNPYLQSELVYNYIIKKYPWAGAREYSTIPCIPQYVIEEHHGDCGQVSLLYISLMRALGVPARWESGWMLHPGEKNLHDWAEVYFEGIGWVPVDVSFGRYTTSPDVKTQNFYSTGMDRHRFATNKAVGAQLYPAKKYVRSETVDFQLGEVETAKGNLFYPAWSQKLTLNETDSQK